MSKRQTLTQPTAHRTCLICTFEECVYVGVCRYIPEGGGSIIIAGSNSTPESRWMMPLIPLSCLHLFLLIQWVNMPNQSAISTLLIFIPKAGGSEGSVSGKTFWASWFVPQIQYILYYPCVAVKQKNTCTLIFFSLPFNPLVSTQEDDGLGPDRFLPARHRVQQHLPQHQVWRAAQQHAASPGELSASEPVESGSGPARRTDASPDR